MRVFTFVPAALVLFIGSTFSKQDICWKYGECDPGPNCDNYDGNGNRICVDCCDGGFVPLEKENDGFEDCRKGTDEWDGFFLNTYQKSKRNECLRPKQKCSDDSECCSEICFHGKCWDERCE